MGFFDLHCDTLYRAITENGSIFKNDYHLSVNRGLRFSPWMQCFAVWIPDEVRGEQAINLVNRAYDLLKKETALHEDKLIQCKSKEDILKSIDSNKCSAIFTIEGGGSLGGQLESLDKFKSMGVRMITLTWNGACEIGDGVEVSQSKGFTSFGKSVIKRMEELDIVVDVSHASDKLFFDVAEESAKPIVASHSNSRTICRHKRNLTDEQFKFIRDSGGIVGLNFSDKFLNNDPEKSSIEDIFLNAEYFLSLGGNKTVCIGSDFDGTDMPKGVCGIESIEDIAECFLKHNYSEELVNDILFKNAYNFFVK